MKVIEQNANKGTPGVNKQSAQNQGNIGNQIAANQAGKNSNFYNIDNSDFLWNRFHVNVCN